MLKFYFHVRDGETLIPDEEGMVLKDWTAIQIEGHKSAWEIGKQFGSYPYDLSVEIVDQFGTIVDRIAIAPPHQLPC